MGLQGARLSKVQIEALTKALALGCTYERAAILAGLTVESLHRIRRKGLEAMIAAEANGKRIPWTNYYVRVARACEDGREQWIASELEQIRIHAEHDWHASAWMLERRERERFGPRETKTIDLTTKSQGRDLDYSKLTDDELATLEDLLSKAQPDDDDES